MVNWVLKVDRCLVEVLVLLCCLAQGKEAYAQGRDEHFLFSLNRDDLSIETDFNWVQPKVDGTTRIKEYRAIYQPEDILLVQGTNLLIGKMKDNYWDLNYQPGAGSYSFRLTIHPNPSPSHKIGGPAATWRSGDPVFPWDAVRFFGLHQFQPGSLRVTRDAFTGTLRGNTNRISGRIRLSPDGLPLEAEYLVRDREGLQGNRLLYEDYGISTLYGPVPKRITWLRYLNGKQWDIHGHFAISNFNMQKEPFAQAKFDYRSYVDPTHPELRIMLYSNDIPYWVEGSTMRRVIIGMPLDSSYDGKAERRLRRSFWFVFALIFVVTGALVYLVKRHRLFRETD